MNEEGKYLSKVQLLKFTPEEFKNHLSGLLPAAKVNEPQIELQQSEKPQTNEMLIQTTKQLITYALELYNNKSATQSDQFVEADANLRYIYYHYNSLDHFTQPFPEECHDLVEKVYFKELSSKERLNVAAQEADKEDPTREIAKQVAPAEISQVKEPQQEPEKQAPNDEKRVDQGASKETKNLNQYIGPQIAKIRQSVKPISDGKGNDLDSKVEIILHDYDNEDKSSVKNYVTLELNKLLLNEKITAEDLKKVKYVAWDESASEITNKIQDEIQKNRVNEALAKANVTAQQNNSNAVPPEINELKKGNLKEIEKAESNTNSQLPAKFEAALLNAMSNKGLVEPVEQSSFTKNVSKELSQELENLKGKESFVNATKNLQEFLSSSIPKDKSQLEGEDKILIEKKVENTVDTLLAKQSDEFNKHHELPQNIHDDRLNNEQEVNGEPLLQRSTDLIEIQKINEGEAQLKPVIEQKASLPEEDNGVKIPEKATILVPKRERLERESHSKDEVKIIYDQPKNSLPEPFVKPKIPNLELDRLKEKNSKADGSRRKSKHQKPHASKDHRKDRENAPKNKAFEFEFNPQDYSASEILNKEEITKKNLRDSVMEGRKNTSQTTVAKSSKRFLDAIAVDVTYAFRKGVSEAGIINTEMIAERDREKNPKGQILKIMYSMENKDNVVSAVKALNRFAHKYAVTQDEISKLIKPCIKFQENLNNLENKYSYSIDHKTLKKQINELKNVKNELNLEEKKNCKKVGLNQVTSWVQKISGEKKSELGKGHS